MEWVGAVRIHAQRDQDSGVQFFIIVNEFINCSISGAGVSE